MSSKFALLRIALEQPYLLVKVKPSPLVNAPLLQLIIIINSQINTVPEIYGVTLLFYLN